MRQALSAVRPAAAAKSPPGPDRATFGAALRLLRSRAGLRQYHLAEAAGVTKAMLSAYETGRQRPSLDTLLRILETLGCDFHHLQDALDAARGVPSGTAWGPERRVWRALQEIARALRMQQDGDPE